MKAVSWLHATDASEQWREALRTRGPRLAVWVLALALGVQAAFIVTGLPGMDAASTAGTAQPAAAAPAQRLNVAAITNSHLFGAAPAAAGNADTHAPRTTMPLVLTGIIAVHNPRDGMAIIGPNATSAKVMAVGDDLPGGARLYSVYDDRVLLKRNGHLESLTLPHDAAAAGPPTAPPTPNPLVSRVRGMMASQPGLLANVIRPQPVFAEGRQRGYRVYPGRDRQAFLRLGLRPGDLVVAINGTPLDDPGRSEEVFNTLGSSSEAHVTVVRNGQQQDVTLNIAQLANEARQLMQKQTHDAPAAGPPPPSRGGHNE